MQEITTDFSPGEVIVRESRAERTQVEGEHKGKLWLTNRRLIFKPDAPTEPYELSIRLTDIASVERGSSVVEPIVIVKLRNGRHEQFRAAESDKWIALIDTTARSSVEATVMRLPAADGASTLPMEGLPPGPSAPQKHPSTTMRLLTRLSRSPFAGQERPSTAEMQLQLDRQRRSLLLVVLLGLTCIAAGGCAVLVLMLAMS